MAKTEFGGIEKRNDRFVYIVIKQFYGDFDILVSENILVTEDVVLAENKKDKLNRNRDKRDFVHGEWREEYIVEKMKLS